MAQTAASRCIINKPKIGAFLMVKSTLATRECGRLRGGLTKGEE